MRLAYYAGASTAAAAACLLKAFHERPNFYSATVYLSQSNACLLILTNLLLIVACGMVYALQRLLYGPLRPIEIEQLSEKAWYAVLDTLLAMPSFREDVGGWLLTMFVLLLAGKVWGWIGEGRVDILEQQPPANLRLFHARLANSLIFSVVFDVWMTRYCFNTVAADPRPGMMVIFTFEFAILTVFSTFTLCRYVLSLVSTIVSKQQMVMAIEQRKTEIRAERVAAQQNEIDENIPSPDGPIEVDENEVDVPGWEEKRRWLFGLEMTADFLKLLLYIIFFTVSITFNGLPMHIMRDVYMTFASFTKRLGDYVNYKKATSDMNARYPDATTTEIRDDACIVCREDMVAWQGPAVADQGAAGIPPRRDEGLRAKKLPCGHILHLRCLKAWLERQQVCPTCRRPVIVSTVPITNTTQANPPGANANAAPAAGGNAPQPRPAQQNRARFFNLGPLRIGFLNGPVGQVDNIVNQLRGIQPPQGQAGNAPPENVQQPTNAASLSAPAGAQQLLPQTDARLSQNDIAQISHRFLREATTLNIEQGQLALLRGMAQDLERLMHLHNISSGQPHVPALVPGPTTLGQMSALSAQSLHGHPSQSIAAGAVSLPEGLILPEGWTLMPLHRQQHQAVIPQAPVATQGLQAMQPTQNEAPPTQVSSAPITHIQESSNSHEPPGGPRDDAGSPLFIPTAIAPAAHSILGTTAASTATGSSPSEEQSQPVPRAPWTGDNWDFDAPAQQEPGDAHSERSGSSNKGKGRAVEVEDAPDPES